MPVFRREFSLRAKPRKAVLRIVGLGQWQATIGHAGHAQPLEAKGLHGDWTDYRKTIAFDTVDVTSKVGEGLSMPMRSWSESLAWRRSSFALS